MAKSNIGGSSYGKEHFGTVKAIATAMASFEETNKKQLIEDYDLDRISAYRCLGNELTGSSVIGYPSGKHFLVASESYDVYEIPSKSNGKSIGKGKFMVLFKNKDLGYWLLASLNYTCGTRKEKLRSVWIKEFFEKAEYDLIAESTIEIVDGKYVKAYWGKRFSEIVHRVPSQFSGMRFDNCDTRKRTVYGLSMSQLMSKFGARAA